MEPLVPTQWQYQKHYRNFDAIDTTKDDMIFLQVYMRGSCYSILLVLLNFGNIINHY